MCYATVAAYIYWYVEFLFFALHTTSSYRLQTRHNSAYCCVEGTQSTAATVVSVQYTAVGVSLTLSRVSCRVEERKRGKSLCTGSWPVAIKGGRYQ